MKQHFYTKYEPRFYRSVDKSSGKLTPICELIASHAGLWNLAWLTNPAAFAAYENDAIPANEKPQFSLEARRNIMRLGKTKVDGVEMINLAATLPAKEFLAAVEMATKVVPTLESELWNTWLRVVNTRVALSTDTECSEETFMRPTDLAEQAETDADFHKRSPAPLLHDFITTDRFHEFDLLSWLESQREGTVH